MGELEGVHSGLCNRRDLQKIVPARGHILSVTNHHKTCVFTAFVDNLQFNSVALVHWKVEGFAVATSAIYCILVIIIAGIKSAFIGDMDAYIYSATWFGYNA